MKSMALYFVAVSDSQQVVGCIHLYWCSRAKPDIRVINQSAVVKFGGLERAYLRYQICALTACLIRFFKRQSTFFFFSHVVTGLPGLNQC